MGMVACLCLSRERGCQRSSIRRCHVRANRDHDNHLYNIQIRQGRYQYDRVGLRYCGRMPYDQRTKLKNYKSDERGQCFVQDRPDRDSNPELL